MYTKQEGRPKSTWYQTQMNMKRTITLVVIVVVLIGIAAFVLTRRPEQSTQTDNATHSAAHPSGHDSSPQTKSVPAHYETEPPRISLAPTLEPEDFTGKTRAAYRAVREVPQLIAQLPCYCYCDRGFGHKSLHSCYVDDHAAHCAVCVDEVLLAYDLQKKGLPAKEIREQIITRFGG